MLASFGCPDVVKFIDLRVTLASSYSILSLEPLSPLTINLMGEYGNENDAILKDMLLCTYNIWTLSKDHHLERLIVYKAQKKIDLQYEIYRTQFYSSSSCRERIVPTAREVLGKFYTFIHRLSYREKDKTKNCLDRKAINAIFITLCLKTELYFYIFLKLRCS